MADLLDKIETITDQEMVARYQRAQSLMQGLFSTSIACNTTVIPHWIGASDCFWYEREYTVGREFRLVDAKLLTNEIAFDHGDLARALTKASGQNIDAEDLPIQKVQISLSPLQVEFDSFGSSWLFSDHDKTCTEVGSVPNNWLISPDGSMAAFTRNNNIWVRELDTDQECALTQDGEPFYSYSSPPSAYGLQRGNQMEAVWSPDSKYLFTVQVDTRSVKPLPILKHVPQDGSIRPIIAGANRTVAFPNDANIDEYRFLAINVETGQQQDAHYRRCPVFRNASGYFSTRHGWWGDDSRHAYFIELSVAATMWSD